MSSDEIAELRVTLDAAPMQAEGRIRDGRWFYFRARGRHLELGLSAVDVEDACEATIDQRSGSITLWVESDWLGEFPLSGFSADHIPGLVAWLVAIVTAGEEDE